MKAIKVTTGNEISTVEIGHPKLECMQKEVDGFIEVARTKGLMNPFVMIVDEEGLLKNKELNIIGSLLYGTHRHGHPIVGDVLIMREEPGPKRYGNDFYGLTDPDIASLTAHLKNVYEINKQLTVIHS